MSFSSHTSFISMKLLVIIKQFLSHLVWTVVYLKKKVCINPIILNEVNLNKAQNNVTFLKQQTTL